MLKEKTLWGVNDRVKIAISRIKEFEPMAVMNNPAGYHVCISGGKDSSVIQELCLMSDVKCEFVHNHTSVDHPETVYFVRREMERIKKGGHIFRIEVPRFCDGRQKTMWNGIEKKGLPTRRVRWCCQELKEYSGKGRYKITGVRWAESPKRKKRALHESLTKKIATRITLNNDNDMKRKLSEICMQNQTLVLNPIIDWSDDDVWNFLHDRKVPLNPLYEAGYKRVGCIGCPLAGSKQQMRDFERYPKYRDAYIRAAKKHIEYRNKKGLGCRGVMETPERYFEWWLGGKAYKSNNPMFVEWEKEAGK
jgi:phosphoadenosine phosphosulfate reductase